MRTCALGIPLFFSVMTCPEKPTYILTCVFELSLQSWEQRLAAWLAMTLGPKTAKKLRSPKGFWWQINSG